jgi:CheY-like chemotaxis protein
MASRKRILLLDNDERVLLDLQRRLEDEGFDTATTWDAVEALELARTRHFDLLLVGDHPPEISGAEILRDLQCGRLSLPCVIMQAGRGPFDPEFLYSLGAAGVIADSRKVDVPAWIHQRFAQRSAAAAAGLNRVS